jgi:hypothetical protein
VPDRLFKELHRAHGEDAELHREKEEEEEEETDCSL